MIKYCSVFLVFVVLLFPVSVFATFDFSTQNTSITDAEDLTISVTLDLSNSTANNTYYLRGAFYKEGTTKYFGYTLDNSGDPYNGPFSDCQNLFEITVDGEGNWSGNIKVKADPLDSAFEGSGKYEFKVGRYTTSCSSATWTDTDPIKINITQTIFPSPSPSPTPESNSSTSASTAKSPPPKATPKTITKKSPSPSPKVLSAQTSIPSTQSAQRGGIENSIAQVDPNQFNPPSSAPSTQKATNKFAALLVGSGAVMIGISVAGFLWYKRQEGHSSIQKERQRFEEE